MIVTNKTLSPQYLLWLGGPRRPPCCCSAAAPPPAERPAIRRTAYALLLLALLTHLDYPAAVRRDSCGAHGASPMTVVATVVTAVRNLALLAFTGYVGRLGLALPRRWTARPRRCMIKSDRPGNLPCSGRRSADPG